MPSCPAPHAAPYPADSNDSVVVDAKPLSFAQAQQLRPLHRLASPWVVLKWQALVGLFLSVALAAWDSSTLGSALYGVAVVVVSAMVTARAMTQSSAKTPAQALLSFMVWELTKIVVAITLLVAAAVAVPGVQWPVLLLTMIVCLKVNWLVLLMHRPAPTQPPSRSTYPLQQHVR